VSLFGLFWMASGSSAISEIGHRLEFVALRTGTLGLKSPLSHHPFKRCFLDCADSSAGFLSNHCKHLPAGLILTVLVQGLNVVGGFIPSVILLISAITEANSARAFQKVRFIFSHSMAELIALRKQLEETKEKLRIRQLEEAEREARGEASRIFKTVSRKTDSSIFENPTWLQPICDPPDFFPISREAYVESLRALLAPVLCGAAGRNVFVVGRPGTGKTLTVRFVLEQLKHQVENSSVSIGVVFVNAGRTRSPYHTLAEILRSLEVEVPVAGWQSGRLKEEFERQRQGKSIVIAIDEADSLVSKTREQLLYYLNRQERVTLILITNQWDDLSKLPARARSTLQLAPLIFEPYTKQEAKRILVERCALAFKVGAVDDEAIDLASVFAAEMQDIRAGFNLLLTAGLLAEGHARSKVDLVDLQRAERAIRPTI